MSTSRVLALLAFVALHATAEAADPVVVVHPSTRVLEVSKAELSKIFLKRLRTWADGSLAQPIDQVPGPVREEFTQWVHGRSVVTIEVYWKRMIFSGRAVPPAEAADDAAVLDFVRRTPGAVGYVSGSAQLDGVRKLDLRE
ncbi:MAG: hypothetical protein OES32_16985 [Acidobacteriota bacterium]|nr:hypothetical protein [Acidobacteriota bacterium]MDH3525275.1 hypothetical protein [Acidobacteriota bacterium]